MEKNFPTTIENADLMNVHELARYLRFCEAKVYKMAQEGSIPAIRIGKSWRFRRDVIDEWIRRGADVNGFING